MDNARFVVLMEKIISYRLFVKYSIECYVQFCFGFSSFNSVACSASKSSITSTFRLHILFSSSRARYFLFNAIISLTSPLRVECIQMPSANRSFLLPNLREIARKSSMSSVTTGKPILQRFNRAGIGFDSNFLLNNGIVSINTRSFTKQSIHRQVHFDLLCK